MKQETLPVSVKKIGPMLAVGLLLGGAGCANTLSGAKQDAATDTQKVSTAADQATAGAKAEARKAGAAVEAVPQDAKAVVVTPEVKTDIIRDPVLNDPRNVVNVSSSGHTVQLTGHVATDAMKTRATEDAEAALSKHHPDFKVSNEMTVTSGTP